MTDILAAKRTIFYDPTDFPLPENLELEPVALRDFLKQNLGKGSLLLAYSEYEAMGAEPGLLGDAAFEHDDVLEEILKDGRERSVNGVYFRRLRVRPFGGDELCDFVAVKPLLTPALVAHEYGATLYVNSLQPNSTPNSFVPLGFYGDDDGKFSLVTRFEMPVRSMDNVFLSDGSIRLPEQLARMKLFYAAGLLGYLHVNGLVHCDMQVRNVATDGVRSRVIDLTGMRRFNLSKPTATDINDVFTDVRTFLRSIMGFRGIEPFHVMEYFAPIYVDYINHPESKLDAVIRLTLEDIRSICDF